MEYTRKGGWMKKEILEDRWDTSEKEESWLSAEMTKTKETQTVPVSHLSSEV